jgi:hypothetical protein
MGALLEVIVHECSRGGMASCQNWSEVGHVLAELGVHHSVWHMMAAFSVRWKHSTSLLATGWWAVVRES